MDFSCAAESLVQRRLRDFVQGRINLRYNLRYILRFFFSLTVLILYHEMAPRRDFKIEHQNSVPGGRKLMHDLFQGTRFTTVLGRFYCTSQ